MIEYLYDAIRASAGTDITVSAKVTDDDGNPITEGCMFMLHTDEMLLVSVEGEYVEDTWFFTIPKEVTKGLHGRYRYCICTENDELCFKQPIYFV